MATETHATPRNRRLFLRMIALGAGVAALAACGATAAKPSLTEAERAELEALGEEFVADLAAGRVKRLKGTDGVIHYGTVVVWQRLGYGHIMTDSGEIALFVYSSLIDEVDEGNDVEFEIGGYTLKGNPRAVNIRNR